jgi:uncharacterized membrane protein YeiB
MIVKEATAYGTAQPAGPVTRAERAFAPDLTRGAMLLLIAVANAVGVVFAGELAVEPNPHGLERAVNLLMYTFVHSRAYPVFAVMFGYGLVQMARRQEAAGVASHVVRSLLLRRNAWLILFGFAHAALLYSGDFLGAYGIAGILAALLLLRRGDRVHRAVLWIWGFSAVEFLVLAVSLALHVLHASAGAATHAAQIDIAEMHVATIGSLLAPDYGTSMLQRLAEWPVHTIRVVPFIMIVWLGMWAARHKLLEDLREHRRLLRRISAVSLAIVTLGGLPLGLFSTGIFHADASAVNRMILLQEVSGMFGGPGYAALFGILALHLSGARSSSAWRFPITLLTALGQRSLSGYLFQSVAWLLLLAPYTLGLGQRFGSPMLTAIAVGMVVWFLSLLGAYLLDRHCNRGPAEVILRKLTYGNKAAISSARQ